TFGDAVDILDRADKPRAAAHVLRSWQEFFQDQSNWKRAEASLEKALAFDRRTGEESLAIAESMERIGVVTDLSGDRVRAKELLLRPLAIEARLAPTSFMTARTLGRLARILSGQLEEQWALNQRRVRILEDVAPESLWLADAMVDRGAVAVEQGNFSQGED